MKVTLNWLKQYVDFDWSPEELAERLTLLGIEVEGMVKLSGEFEGVVVAQILASEKHPNADKLALCRVDDGRGQRQIVCGAKNYQVGDKVPLALPGCTLPTPAGAPPFTIKVGKIRGLESQGMLCSPKELGIAEDAEGLLILSSDAKVGQPFNQYLGRAQGDVVYDLEITPNRPDLNSVIGIAREISAVTGAPLRLPELKIPETESAVEGVAAVQKFVSVRIEDPELCPRYTARVGQGVKIGPSPDWLKQTLERVGVRSINNVVDVTNYVMLETGQPLHAFDFHLLAKSANELEKPAAIVIRRARPGEKFTTLDGQERTLTKDMLLIADETKAIALAGVMGGRNSEINESTKDVLLESAYFKPQNIRATSKQLDLRTDASYRFERGADIGICEWASRRAAQLILETSGGVWVPGVVDAYPHPLEIREIALRHEKVDQLLGVSIPAAKQLDYLRRLQLEIVLGQSRSSFLAAQSEHNAAGNSNTSPAVTVRVPTFRVDLKREIDLVEEIARLYGVDKIPASSPRSAVGEHGYDRVHDRLSEARRLLTGLGLHEAQGQTLVSERAAQLLAGQPVTLQNPLSAEMNVLRSSLLPSLLEALRQNLHHKSNDAALFEIGRVFFTQNAEVREERRIAIALTGQRNRAFWSGEDRIAKADIFDLKGLVEEFLDQFGVRGLAYHRRAENTRLYLESAVIQMGNQPIGELGQLSPLIAKQYDLRDAVLLSELNLDLLLARSNIAKSFKALPAFPAVRRDVAMLVSNDTTHETVINAVNQARPPNLESVEIFDVFRGRNVPAGQKSVAYAFTYRHSERTLTDAEVNAAHERLVEQLRQGLKAVIREG